MKHLIRRVGRSAYGKIFGFAPFYRRTHPRWADVQPVLKGLRDKPTPRVLHVASATLGAHRFAAIATECLAVDEVLKSGDGPERAHAVSVLRGNFDGCIVELDRRDLVYRSKRLIARVVSSVPDGSIFIFHEGDATDDPTLMNQLIDRDELASDLENRIYFSGSRTSAAAAAVFARAVGRLRSGAPLQVVLGAVTLCASIVSAWSVNRNPSIVRNRRGSGPYASMTFEFATRGYRPVAVALDDDDLPADDDDLPADGDTHELLAQNDELRKRVEFLEAQTMVRSGLADAESEFATLFRQCKPSAMTSVERLYMLFESVEYIVANKIPGSIVETGVWRDGSCMLAALALRHFGDTARRIVIFDALVDGVRADLLSTEYPSDNLTFVAGPIEQTLAQYESGGIALLQLDSDGYEKTRACLERLYPKLVSGGVLLITDYNRQRQAVDEYFATIGERPLLSRIDYSCRLAVKSAAPVGK